MVAIRLELDKNKCSLIFTLTLKENISKKQKIYELIYLNKN